MIIRIWRICRICRPLETGWRKDRCNASGTNFKRNLACFQSTLFILQSFCNHLSLLQNHFIDLLLNHHKITELRTLTFYQFIAFYLSHVQFVTATIAFVNTLLNQALWISLMTLLINNQNLYFFFLSKSMPERRFYAWRESLRMQGKSLPWSIKEDIKLTQSSLNSLGKSDLRNSNLHGIKDFYLFCAWCISLKA